MKKRFLQGMVDSATAALKSVRVIASTAAVDRQGESLDPNGWDFSNFLKNPQLLWSHDASALPIGKVSKVWIDNGQLMAETQFAEEENPFAAQVAKMVRAGYINAVSVGFLPKTMDPNTGNVLTQELLELSFVNIPANQEALVIQRSAEGEAMLKSFKEEEQKAIRAIHQPTEKATEATLTIADLAAEVKAGRVLSEKNRNEVRLMVDACRQAADAGQKLLDATEPPEKKSDPTPSRTAGPATGRLRALRIMDRAVEILIQAEKEAQSIDKRGGAMK